MTTTDTSKTEGGSVLSNIETIRALRQGVEVDQRTCVIELKDHEDFEHQIPVTVMERSGEVAVVIQRDVLDEVERRALGPRRRSGTVELGALDSLVEYVNRYKGEDAVAFAPLSPPGVTVVFDYHPKGDEDASWCVDRATFKCPLSRQWKLWTENEPKSFGQAAFGDLLEQNGDDIHGDDEKGLAGASRMLEVARNLVIHQTGKYERKINPTTGEGTLVASDEHSTNSTKIPKAFGLAIPVFEGSTDLYPVECRIRFAMVEGKPTFSYLIHNRAQVFEHALAELRKAVADRCGIPVFVGPSPAAK